MVTLCGRDRHRRPELAHLADLQEADRLQGLVLTNLRGQILDTTQVDAQQTRITAEVPLAEVQARQGDIEQTIGDHTDVEMKPLRYDPVPAHLVESILKAASGPK